tara:strand:- start:308 stop:583 length:276 start_codon:yes stop_codon:yes gene_type:complete
MREDNVHLVVGIVEIGPLMKFDRVGKSSFVKKNVTLKTMTDKLIFAEIRKMELLEGIVEGDVVDVKMSFSGSQKGEKKYNNIFINGIIKKG